MTKTGHKAIKVGNGYRVELNGKTVGHAHDMRGCKEIVWVYATGRDQGKWVVEENGEFFITERMESFLSQREWSLKMSKTLQDMKREWEEDELRYEVEKARSGKTDFFEYLEKQGMHDLADKIEQEAKSNNSANDVQVGGSHYKDKKIQPWDFIVANGIGYLEGCAIKYLCRWRDKGGIDDLKKARHYLEKLIEVESSEK